MRSIIRYAAVTAALAATGATFGTTVGAAEPTDRSTERRITRCDEMPDLWSGSTGIRVDQHTRTVTLDWEQTGETATLSLDDVNCAGQSGLEQLVSDEIRYQAEMQRQDCQNLRQLVAHLNGKGVSSGKARITAADERVISGQTPPPGKPVDRTVDVDAAKRVIDQLCKGNAVQP